MLECNKSDLPGAIPADDLAVSLGQAEAPAIRASAIQGEGVFDALRAISKLIVARL